MATVFIKHGEEFPYTNGTSNPIKSNDVVVMNDVVGVALSDILVGSTGTVQVAGVAQLKKKTGQAWSQGQKLYFDNLGGTPNNWFTTSADNGASPAVAFVFAGWAYADAASGDTSGQVKLKVS
jgi:predicted RecA/RadA family phage recombinase